MSRLADGELINNIVTYSEDDDESRDHNFSACADDLTATKNYENEESDVSLERANRHDYKDFSHIPPHPSSFRSNLFTSRLSSVKEPTFPVKLHTILSNPEFEDIIAWLPHGRSWRILQQKAFEERVIPLYFRHGRYSSFARQVNGWGFRRVTHGSDYNSYYQEMFLRGMPHLCNMMRRLTAKDLADQKNKQIERVMPDFYQLSKENPLPAGKCHASPSTRAVVNERIPRRHQQHPGNSTIGQTNTDLAILLSRSNLLSFDQGLNRRGESLQGRLANLKNIQLLQHQCILRHQQEDDLFLSRSNLLPRPLDLLNPGLSLASTAATAESRKAIMRQRFLMNNLDAPRLLESMINRLRFSQTNSFRGTQNFGEETSLNDRNYWGKEES